MTGNGTVKQRKYNKKSANDRLFCIIWNFTKNEHKGGQVVHFILVTKVTDVYVCFPTHFP